MAGHDIIVVGASAGGIPAVIDLLGLLPSNLPATIFVMVHRSSASPATVQDALPEVLMQKTQLPVLPATDGQPFERAHVYVAPPMAFLRLAAGRVSVTPDANRTAARVGVDVLFRSAAAAYGNRVVAVLMSGMLDDGTAGLWEVRKSGGISMVVDPATAQFPSMPRAGMERVPVHYCLRIPEMATELVQLASEPPETRAPHDARPRVLIVEDERIVAANLASQLADLGYNVVGSIRSGEEALASVVRASPDVVLMDIALAGPMKGTEAARLLWEQLKLPVVFLTAYTDEKTLGEAEAAMPYGFVVKPYRAPEVHIAIRLALARREQEMRAAST